MLRFTASLASCVSIENTHAPLLVLVMRLWHTYRNDLQTAMTLKLS